MQKRTADGGLTTTDDKQDHYPYPCVSHPPELPCIVVQDAVRRGKFGILLRASQRKVPTDGPPGTR